MDPSEQIETYLATGIAVFPLHGVWRGSCTCRRPCPSPAKHPLLGLAHGPNDPRRHTCRGECGRLGHGLHDATTDPTQVGEWLARFPWANWGIRPPVGILVLDVDPRNNGHVELLKLEREHGRLPETLTAETGSGGEHRWLSYNGPTRGKLCPGVDVKSNTGYLVAPPSTHITGGRYRWVDLSPAAYAPDWVKAVMNPPVRLRSPRAARGGGQGLVGKVAGTPYGEINDVLYWAACRADEQGILDDILEDLVKAAEEAAGPAATPAGDMQSRRTIESARRRPATYQPRQAPRPPRAGAPPWPQLMGQSSQKGA